MITLALPLSPKILTTSIYRINYQVRKITLSSALQSPKAVL